MRNRIKELREVRAGDLLPDPRNYRRHPAAQRKAMAQMVERLGYVNAVVARETHEGLMLIDGHLRSELDPEQTIPVLVVDLDEQESAEALATMDPLAAMAEDDQAAFDSLLAKVVREGAEIKALVHAVTGFDPLTVSDHTLDAGEVQERQARLQAALLDAPASHREANMTCPGCAHEFVIVREQWDA